MKNRQEKIYSILQKIASEMQANDLAFSVETPKDKSHGDLASNIALVLFKNLNLSRGPVPNRSSSPVKQASSLRSAPLASPLDKVSSPLDLAQEIVQLLTTDYSLLTTDFDRVEVAAPGFINFYFSQKFLSSQVGEIINQDSKYGESDIGNKKKASVEFVSANPTGPLHIGNARGGPLGDTIANVLSKAGYEVTREYLHNDVGGQVAKLGETIYFSVNPDKKPEDEEVQYSGEYVKELSEKISSKLDASKLSKEEFVEKAGKIAVEIMLSKILEDCKLMGITFDKIRKESELRNEIPQVLEKLKKSLKEKDGALWFASINEFLKDRETVVKKSNGEYTYFASDIVYHYEKMSNFDTVIDILGSNHSGHVPRLQAVIKALGFDVANFKVVLYQYVRLKRGEEIVKMSKRAGNIVTAREVLDEVGKDAFRFFLLTPRSQTHMDFDLELAKKKASDNPVFYIQYAYARISSVFAKLKTPAFATHFAQAPRVKKASAGKQNSEDVNLNLLTSKEEMELIRNLIQLPNLVEKVTETLEVNAFCNYALETATLFHKFYETQRVISEDKNLTKARLALIKATQITLKNTLDLLGVTAPEKM